jgi:5-methylcytosine-specific restriction protein A
MPYRPRAHCTFPGCNGVAIAASRCAIHQAPRRSSTQLGYGYAWQKLRAEYLAAYPWCAQCWREGVYTQATDLDHIVSKQKGGTDEWSNLQGLCARHHSSKTVTVDGGFGRGQS